MPDLGYTREYMGPDPSPCYILPFTHQCLDPVPCLQLSISEIVYMYFLKKATIVQWLVLGLLGDLIPNLLVTFFYPPTKIGIRYLHSSYDS